MSLGRIRLQLLHVTTVPQSLLFLRGQSGFMRAYGIQDIAFASSPSPQLAAFAAEEGTSAHGIEMHRRIVPHLDLLSVFHMTRLLRGMRPQVVHAHTPKGGLIGMISAFLARTPVRIYQMHGLPLMTSTGLRRRLLKWSEKVSCRLSHQVLCVSESIRAEAIREGLCPHSKMKVLHRGSINGVDARDRFSPDRFPEPARVHLKRQFEMSDEALVIGFIGRIVRDKGWTELADAWNSLRNECPELHMLVVGPFESQDPVGARITSMLEKDERVHLVGEDYDVAPFYSIMDILVLPTYREGFPVVPLEAAAMEVPVVATTIPGCIDAIEDGVTGTLVPPRDAEALGEAIARYLDDPRLRRRHGAAGRERVLRDFRPEDIWEELYQEYVRLLRERGIEPLDPQEEARAV